MLLRVKIGPAGFPSTQADLAALRPGQSLIAFLDPLSDHALVRQLAERQVSAFSMELMPRITRAQSMDALSSMATIAGYKAVLLAAVTVPRMFPMLMTAAGNVALRAFSSIGVGVAGLQAIATAKAPRRAGAGVRRAPGGEGADQSLGAKVVDVPLETADARGQRRLREGPGRDVLSAAARGNGQGRRGQRHCHHDRGDPGKQVAGADHRGDGARHAARLCDRRSGGRARRQLRVDPRRTKSSTEHGVTILGPTNLPSTVPYHASQMYAKNITTFLTHLVNKEGTLNWDLTDEITRETLVTHKGEVVQPRVKGLVLANA